MRSRLLTLLMLFAVAFGSLMAPEAGHAETLAVEQGVEAPDTHDHASAVDDGQPSHEDGSPCHATGHHHCGLSIAVDDQPIALKGWDASALPSPRDALPLASLLRAPPTQPPAA